MSHSGRIRPAEALGNYSKLHGEYKMAAQSGLVTLAAAATTTAGHMFVMSNPSTTKCAVIRYVSAQFATTTPMTNQQAMGYDLCMMNAASVVYTGGTAIDMFTLTRSQKNRSQQALTLFTVNRVRIATTAGLTAGTQELDSLPMAHKMFLSPLLGDTATVVLLDARDDGSSTVRSPLLLNSQDGFVIRNTVLMGAAGVGYLTVNVEWDEVTL